MDTTVMLGHGSGGTMMKRIIDDVFFAAYAGDELLRSTTTRQCCHRPLRVSGWRSPPTASWWHTFLQAATSGAYLRRVLGTR